MSPLVGTIIAALAPEEAGAASGVVTTSLQTGNVLGVAAFALVFFSIAGAAAPGVDKAADATAFSEVLPAAAAAAAVPDNGRVFCKRADGATRANCIRLHAEYVIGRTRIQRIRYPCRTVTNSVPCFPRDPESALAHLGRFQCVFTTPVEAIVLQRINSLLKEAESVVRPRVE